MKVKIYPDWVTKAALEIREVSGLRRDTGEEIIYTYFEEERLKLSESAQKIYDALIEAVEEKKNESSD